MDSVSLKTRPANSLANLKSWQPGESGNPGGRPKAVHDVVELSRTFTKEAVYTLAGIMQNVNEPASSRVSAASILLDRGWGKPLQTLATPDGNSPISLHLLATQFVGKQLLAERAEQPLPPTIQHEGETTNGNAFDLNAPPPNE
jgi:hypothetical protein